MSDLPWCQPKVQDRERLVGPVARCVPRVVARSQHGDSVVTEPLRRRDEQQAVLYHVGPRPVRLHNRKCVHAAGIVETDKV